MRGTLLGSVFAITVPPKSTDPSCRLVDALTGNRHLSVRVIPIGARPNLLVHQGSLLIVLRIEKPTLRACLLVIAIALSCSSACHCLCGGVWIREWQVENYTY